jgi:hypothetical protein
VKTLSKKFGNVFVTVTKSGKLQRQTYEQFLNNVIKPYVKKDKFKLDPDFWGGQTNPSLYNEKFVDKNDESTCSLKIIPPQFRPTCQLCDVCFYK